MLLENSNQLGFLDRGESGVYNHRKCLIGTQKDIFQMIGKGLEF
jgi:hypothetical protein